MEDLSRGVEDFLLGDLLGFLGLEVGWIWNFLERRKIFLESLFTRNFLIFLKKVIVRIRTSPRLDIRDLTQKPYISLSL